MKKMLEELWYLYETRRPDKFAVERERLLRKMEDAEDKLFPHLTNEQKDALDDFRTSVNEISMLQEKEAYYRGIRFATTYMIEALKSK